MTYSCDLKVGVLNPFVRYAHNKISKIITSANEIEERKGEKIIFNYKDIAKNTSKFNPVLNQEDWIIFVINLYKLFHDGVGGEENRILNRLGNDPSCFIIMDIKYLRNENRPANLNATKIKRITEVYQKYTSKEHFSQLSKKEVETFQHDLLDNLIDLLERIKSTI